MNFVKKTELLPFIYVENWFRRSILIIILSVFFKFCMRVDIRKDYLRLQIVFFFFKKLVTAFDLKLW